MEVAALAAQQAVQQLNTGMSMVKNKAQAEQATVALAQQAVDMGARGQNLNITV